ncbi:MAG: GNAT family N-acetyltransferase, partial [Candidatus Tectomicrobia bacterium]|nr:GNAT family N-acetyltransferase [Candidatus Tectomicrobia bacterium]
MNQYESTQPVVAEPAVLESGASIIVRPVRSEDNGDLLQLACMLDTMNLPRDPDVIAGIIATSETAFACLDTPPEQEIASTYTLVATQGSQVLGTASLLSHHGTPADPHYYLRVVEHTFHSAQLNTKRTRHVLRLEHDEEPWTEFGGLIVHPAARGQGIAKLLFAARLLLVAMHP